MRLRATIAAQAARGSYICAITGNETGMASDARRAYESFCRSVESQRLCSKNSVLTKPQSLHKLRVVTYTTNYPSMPSRVCRRSEIASLPPITVSGRLRHRSLLDEPPRSCPLRWTTKSVPFFLLPILHHDAIFIVRLSGFIIALKFALC